MDDVTMSFLDESGSESEDELMEDVLKSSSSNGKEGRTGDRDVEMNDRERIPRNEEEKNEVLGIKVKNPLGLKEDDPLLRESKLRVWRQRHGY